MVGWFWNRKRNIHSVVWRHAIRYNLLSEIRLAATSACLKMRAVLLGHIDSFGVLFKPLAYVDGKVRCQVDGLKVLWPLPNITMLRSALFWAITRRRMVILYRRFGTTYRSHLHGSNSRRRKDSTAWPLKMGPIRCPKRIGPVFKGQIVEEEKILLLGPWRWDRYVVPKRQ
jgi:hypothetical protein